MSITTTTELAHSALNAEGIDAYFAGYDPEIHWELSVEKVLAEWMDANTDAWAVYDDQPWTFDGGQAWADHAASALAAVAEIDAR